MSTANAHLDDVLNTDSESTSTHAISQLVSLTGIESLTVAETPNAVMVVDKSRSRDVKHITLNLSRRRASARPTLPRRAPRLQSYYDNLGDYDRFQVKIFQVNPKANLILQKHNYSAEHRIVVTGTTEIINGDKVLTLAKNQSTDIHLGELYRPANPGNIPCEIIEAQSDRYLGEDDIARFEGTYGRTSA